jgi:hypothetical protein
MLSASEQFAGGRSPRANRSAFPACSPTPGSVDCVDRFCAASLCCVCPQQRQTEEHLTLPQSLVWSSRMQAVASEPVYEIFAMLWKPSPGQGPRTLQAVRPPDDAAGRRAAQQTREAAISGALPQRGSGGCVAACAKLSCCRGVPAQGGTLARITTIKKIGALGESLGHKRQTVGTNLTPGETMTATATKHVTAPCKWTMGSPSGEPVVPAYCILACRRSTRRSLGRPESF